MCSERRRLLLTPLCLDWRYLCRDVRWDAAPFLAPCPRLAHLNACCERCRDTLVYWPYIDTLSSVHATLKNRSPNALECIALPHYLGAALPNTTPIYFVIYPERRLS